MSLGRVGGLLAAIGVIVAVGIASAAGCSSTPVAAPSGAPDASAPEAAVANEASAPDFGAPSTTHPAYALPPLPQLQRGAGITPPDVTVVPVVFAGDTGAADVPTFLTKYAASAEWTASVGEYGVHSLTVGSTVTLSETAPSTLLAGDLAKFVREKLDGSHPEWGPNDDATIARTVYLLVYPSGTQLSDAPGRLTCTDFIGYHAVVAQGLPDGGAPPPGSTHPPIIYAAVARCPIDGYTDAQALTSAISHEVIEAAVDPYAPMITDVAHAAWQVGMLGGEPADLCNIKGSYWTPPSIGFAIARSWSNAAAKVGHAPCVPTPVDEPYFSAFLAPSDSFPIADNPAAPKLDGISVPVGQSRTVDVMLSSDRATLPWDMHAVEVPMIANNPPALALALDRTSGVNGEKVHLTITANRSVNQGVTIVMLASRLGSRETLWFTPVSVR
jgi:hypothetical protein